MELSDKLKGLTVECIMILWRHDHYCDNEILKRIHDYWFNEWVAYKTWVAMEDVDAQIEALLEPTRVDPPAYYEELEGPTELGGMMGLRAPWLDEV